MNRERFDHLFDESFDKLVNKKSDELSSNYKPSWNKVKKQLKFIEKNEKNVIVKLTYVTFQLFFYL